MTADADRILVDNLREALRQIQRLLATGLLASLIFLIIEVRSVDVVQLPGGLPPVTKFIAEGVLMAAYWSVGIQAGLVAARAHRIAEVLTRSPELRAAVLTYPSVATTNAWGPRLAATLVPPILASVALVRSETPPFEWFFVIVSVIGLVAPYAWLAYSLKHPIGGPPAAPYSE
jgi:hypothetical protein